MNFNIKLTMMFMLNYFSVAYNVNNKVAYWRIKRSFILNNLFPKKISPLVRYNNNVTIYSMNYDLNYEEYFVQHGEVPLID